MNRRKLFLRQQQQSSRLGGALFSAFPMMVLKHIASYLAKPSQALFAVSLGNFDMSSISSSVSAATNSISGHKRNSDGSLREKNDTVCLAGIPAESLGHVASFLSGCSRALFGLVVAASNDELLNKNSFAIAGDQWDYLDFGEIEKELAVRLTDDAIKAVLWCINAANKLKRLSLTHCVNITAAGLEPLWGSTVIEQIDLSLVGRHVSPVLLEPWHPPRKMDSVFVPFDPPLSCDIVLPILDSIIGVEQCSLKHLQFPKAWRDRSLSHFYDSRFKPDPAFVHFLSRYNQALTNRGRISCVKCSRDLPPGGYEMVGSSVIADDATVDARSFLMFGRQIHTCSQCMKHYCYRCDVRRMASDFLLELCHVCEKEFCVECSKMYQCDLCTKFYCVDCKGSTACTDNSCDYNYKTCSDCDLLQCLRCTKGFCIDCCTQCNRCESVMCHECDDGDFLQECSNDDCWYRICYNCAAEDTCTCQKCKRAFCGCDSSALCRTCNQTFCRDCVTFRRCDEILFGHSDRCHQYHCVDCPDESFLELAHTCPEVNKAPCKVCRSVSIFSCVRCIRTSCETWQAEKKRLMDDQLDVSKVSGGAGS